MYLVRLFVVVGLPCLSCFMLISRLSFLRLMFIHCYRMQRTQRVCSRSRTSLNPSKHYHDSRSWLFSGILACPSVCFVTRNTSLAPTHVITITLRPCLGRDAVLTKSADFLSLPCFAQASQRNPTGRGAVVRIETRGPEISSMRSAQQHICPCSPPCWSTCVT